MRLCGRGCHRGVTGLSPPRENRLPVVDLHPFEGHGVPFAELASHHYLVDYPRAYLGHLFATAFYDVLRG
jgi:hypothetical protein